MVWFTNFVRPRLRSEDKPREGSVNGQWIHCASCQTNLFDKRLIRDDWVCHSCGHHLPMPVSDRLALIFGGTDYKHVPLEPSVEDPLKFRDTTRYTERLSRARSQISGNDTDAISVARGVINGVEVVAAVFRFDFIGGSMGMAVGQGFIQACREALAHRAVLLAVVSSGGARMQEGIYSLMQMPRTIIGVRSLRQSGIPYIVLLANPSTGGVLASLSMLGDIHLAEPGAVIGFAGRRVIEQTVREKPPEGFQSAEYCLENGFIDAITPRSELRQQLRTLVDLLGRRRGGANSDLVSPAQKNGSTNLLGS